jgi:diguanylate cyclase (GGDEF)-like protein/PAS domain S-box-containing protein
VLLGGLSAAVAIGLFGLYVSREQERVTGEDTAREAYAIAEGAARASSHDLAAGDRAGVEDVLRQSMSDPDLLRIQITDASGIVRADVMRGERGAGVWPVAIGGELQPPRGDQPEAAIAGDKVVAWYPTTSAESAGWVRVELGLGRGPAQESRIIKATVVAAILATLAGSLLFYLLLRRPMRALEQATDFAAALAAQRGGTLNIVAPSEEIGRLTTALNDASVRLADQEASLVDYARHLRSVLDTAIDGILTVDRAGHITAFNHAAERIFGWSAADIVGRSINLLVPAECRQDAGIAGFIGPAGLLSVGAVSQTHGLRRDGTAFPAEVGIDELDLDGDLSYVLSVRDITQRSLAEDELRLAASVFEASSEAILITDEQNRIIAANPAFVELTGHSLAAVLGRDPSLLKSGRHDETFYRAMWQSLRSGGTWHGELWNRRQNGEEFIARLTINTVREASGNIHRYIALFSDITQKKLAEETIWQQANYDILTNLPNRRLLRDRLQQELKRMQRAGQMLALFFIDLDRFKEVNDTHGHDFGDMLLIEAARRVSECVRDTDTVARLGGDEFTVTLLNLVDMSRVEEVGRSILEALARPYHLGRETAYLSASVGITVYPGDGDDLETLLKNADQAMYVAKAQGRNRLSYFTRTLQDAAQKRQLLIRDLRLALPQRQLQVHYQPVVEAESGRIVKAEALLRWRHPQRGLVPPDEFIPLAEDIGLINEIGDWVFREVALQAKSWQQAGYAFQIGINKSPRQFVVGNSEETWLDHLRQIGTAPTWLVIEITEGLLLDERSEVTDKLRKFRDAGVEIAVDDFGTGYSSLAYLKKFDIDYLKIDSSFIRDLIDDPSDRALTEAIIAMAHKLGMQVIAEGVESVAQRDFLRSAGCNFCQGYLFAKALPAAEFETLLRDSRLSYAAASA